MAHRPPRAVDALVRSETLRDLGNDRVAFRHDVLREWAIGNLLHFEPARLDRLPLDRPAPAALARGVELAARMVLEHASSSTQWQSLLDRLSGEGVHGSWRRVVLLALVRSEISYQLLACTSNVLLANNGSLLRELIRLVMAVDVEPAGRIYAALGVDPSLIASSGIHMPSGLSWHRLILWILKLGESLPPSLIPDVADFYFAWSTPTLGNDPLTPDLLPWYFRWLNEIESARHVANFRDLRQPFGGAIGRDSIGVMESTIRSGFLLCCHRTPELAKEYLRLLRQRPNADAIVHSVLKVRGSLAMAAPLELADFTASALIEKPHHNRNEYSYEREKPFTHNDLDFLPPSPGQGPFYELLIHAPQHGRALIRRLVDHAIDFHNEGRDYDADAIIILFPDGERAFPWTRSYTWSRDIAGHYCITSALMALEAWGHVRIENGESFNTVLGDVLGTSGSPAAFLLVAVDLLLSHWPKSREAAVPFVACSKLLCVDRQRQLQDSMGQADLFGLGALNREPVGIVNLASLKKRVSRRVSLEVLLGRYALGDHDPPHMTLKALVHRAADLLGPPAQNSNLFDPALMARHAINLLDPNNWHEVSVQLPDNTQGVAHQYVSPEAERQHLEALSLERAQHGSLEDFSMQLSVLNAMEEPSKSSLQFAAAAVEWAQRVMANLEAREPGEEEDQGEDFLRKNAIVSAATIALRDGDDELRAKYRAWAFDVFAQALKTKDDPVLRFRSGLRYNPVAIAFMGMIHALKYNASSQEIRSLLEVATRGESAAAHGFGVAGTTLAAIDERLLRALLRCAFAACVRPHHRRGLPDEDDAAPVDGQRKRLQKAVEAELKWLSNERPEPNWPNFPAETPRPRHRIGLRGGRVEREEPLRQRSRREEYADHQAAAVWLVQFRNLVDMDKRPWIREMVRAYANWTAEANGSKLDPPQDIENSPQEWNAAYYELLARCLPGLALPDIDQLALVPISSLPDQSFFDILPSFLRSSDIAYFNDRALGESVAVSIRSTVADRLMASAGWKRLRGQRGSSIETHIGPAISVLFFNDSGIGQPPRCYLPSVYIDRLPGFLPVLEKLVKSCPALFVALVTLNLIEVSQKPAHLRFIIASARIWLQSYPTDTEFWVDYGIGRRVCLWIEQVLRQEPASLDTVDAIKCDLEQLLAALVNLGVPEARRLEKLLNKE